MGVMRQGRPKVAAQLKGVFTLNPTTMIMKQGSKQERKALTTSNTKKPSKAKGK